MGCTQYLVMLATKPEYNKKVGTIIMVIQTIFNIVFVALFTTIVDHSLSSSGEVGLPSGPSSLHVTFSKHHLPNILPGG